MSSTRLNRLTLAQQAQLPGIRDKWLAVGLSTARADRARAEQGIRLAYQCAGLVAPALLLWLESPWAGALAAARLTSPWAPRSPRARDPVGDQIRAQGRGPSVRAQIGAPVSDQVGMPVRAQVGVQVRDQVVDQVRNQVRAQVRMPVRTQVGAPVGDLVWESVRTQVGAPVEAAGYGQYDAGWAGWLDAFRSFGLGDVIQPAEGLMMLTEACGWYWPFRGACILTERPSAIRRDAQGRLHSAEAAALIYPDGWAIYAWHGVLVSDAVILRPDALTLGEIQQEPNVEVRRVLLERFGFDRYLAESGALPLHTDETGTLYRCALPGDEPIVIVRVANRTRDPDGRTKHYLLRVPPDMTQARQAVAWTFGQDAAAYRPSVET